MRFVQVAAAIGWMMGASAVAGDDDWKVTDSHGDTHEVALTLDEGTWMSVSVHGETLAFDLLGDIYTMPLSGGAAVRITQSAAWEVEPEFSPDGSTLAYVSDEGGNEQIWLMNADGTDPRQLTEEKVARVTEPVWDPNGEWMLVRRRTVDTRSIGVTEIWQVHLDGGAGFQLTSLDAHPHAAEMTTDGRYIWFSSRNGRFEYNHDPFAGLWQIERLDRTTGDIIPIVYGAGSASRPVLSPDRQTLVFVSRDRTETLLEAFNLDTGRRRVVADWLDRDELEGFALHGTYPGMDFTDDGDLVLWAKGKLWRVSLDDGRRAQIPFEVSPSWTFRTVQRPQKRIEDEVRAKVIRWPTMNAAGDLAFSAMGRLYVQPAGGEVRQLSDGLGYSPAWRKDGKMLAYTTWSDDSGGSLVLSNGRTAGTAISGLGGQLVRPGWTDEGGLVVLRAPSGSTSPDMASVRYWEVLHVEKEGKNWTTSVVTTLGTHIRAPSLRVHAGRVFYLEHRDTAPRSPSEGVLKSIKLDGTDIRDHLVLGGAAEAELSPDMTRVAYKVGHQVHVAAFPHWGGGEVDVGAVPSAKVTAVVGDWVHWSPDSAELMWMAGPVHKSVKVADLFEEDEEEVGDSDEEDEEDEPDPLAERDDVVSRQIDLVVPRSRPVGVVALTNATVVTMDGDEVLTDTTVVISGDRIVSVGAEAPAGAEVIDCTGKTIIPGLIDVHAHAHYGTLDVLPEQEWFYQTALDFGVTTMQDPSAYTDVVFTDAERVAAGFQKGPRVFSTGMVLYGALGNFNAETPDLNAARGHVRRMKAVGAQSVKVYQQSQRVRRQWYVQACFEEEMLCVPEGGGDLWMNMTMAADGFHAVEHALPNAPLYADIRGFYAGSAPEGVLGTAYTPTLLVAYGGLSGEHFFYQHHNPANDERLLRHYPRRDLDARARRPRLMAPDDDWNHQQVARDAAQMAREGVMVTLGAHGQLQGLGVHWELWGLAGPGAMTPHEALRAATIQGARYIGYEADLGSVEEGKLADLVVLDADPLADIHNSTAIHLVIKNGEIFR